MKIPLRDAVKTNGFMSATTLGLIDAYADTEGASWHVGEDFVEIEGITLANYTFGALAAKGGGIYLDMDEYAGVLRLEADLTDGLARIDSFQEVIQSQVFVIDPDVPVGKDITIQIEDVIYTAEAVPEPAGLAVIGVGLLAAFRRRRTM